jgi:hypothetical protein
MHHGYGGELEEAMRRAFHGRFRSDIPVSSEIINWIEPDDTPPTEISVDYILKKRDEYGQWSKRNEDFLNRKFNSWQNSVGDQCLETWFPFLSFDKLPWHFPVINIYSWRGVIFRYPPTA